QHDPAIADPVVEADFAFGRFGFEIRGGIANCQSHGKPPFTLKRCWADPIFVFGNVIRQRYVRFKGRQYQLFRLSLFASRPQRRCEKSVVGPMDWEIFLRGVTICSRLPQGVAAKRDYRNREARLSQHYAAEQFALPRDCLTAAPARPIWRWT